MDNLHLMNIYVCVAEEQSFSAAARRLNISPPAATRAIAALESHLGVKLLNRTTRHVSTTEAGEQYLSDVKRILGDVKMANNTVAGINAAPIGNLAITAPVMFGRMFIIPTIVEFLSRYPDTTIDAVFLDRVVNLLEEGLDIGIRIGDLPDSSMRALRVGSVRLVLCAATSYLDKHGIPNKPDELINHSIISSRAINATNEWRFEHSKNAKTVRLKPRMTVTSNSAAIEAAVSGFGITRVLSYQVAPLLASGYLKIILEDYEPKPRPIHIVHRENHLVTAKVRSFIDLIVKNLRSNSDLN